jgi:hypothetical protein
MVTRLDESPIGQETVEVCALDRFVDDVRANDQVWVKLDVEAMELPTIAGAQRLLARSRCVEIELACNRTYADEPLFFTVAPALYDLGFELAAVQSAAVDETQRTIRFDGLFVRP